MGLYCEPQGNKQEWINRVGLPVGSLVLARHFDEPQDTLPVVLLEQGFVALGVAYSKSELKRFMQGRQDGIWFLVPKSELRKVVPGGEKMKELR